MPNVLDANGLQTATQAELLGGLSTDMQQIYGSDINIDPDDPDGQALNIYVQAALDQGTFLTQINAGFDPDQAIGVILDQRCAYNGIKRLGGTSTVTPVQIITDGACTLYGLDQEDQPAYTVQDLQGNQWQLQATEAIPSTGTYNLNFQAANTGAITTVINTINVPVTVVLQVTSINNPVTWTTLGRNEETDPQFRLRRQQSVSISSQGYLASLTAALLNINGVSSAKVNENDTRSTDIYGIPGNTIWVIVSGSGLAASIAQAIYAKRNAGCGMKGGNSYVITQVDGSPFVVYWDDVTEEDLFIKFTANSLDGINPPNIALIRSQLPVEFVPPVYGQVNINELATQVQDIDTNTLVTSPGFSTSAGGAYTNTLTPTALNFQFGVSSAKIIILPMILSAPAAVPVIVAGLVTKTTVTIASGGATLQFSGLGGYGILTYAKDSGSGSINASSGLYTSAAAGTDILRVTDSLGNTTTCEVTVT